jgi:hypothetical protein
VGDTRTSETAPRPSPTSWTRDDADVVLARIGSLLPGLDLRIVGSVATLGSSDNDLDLAVNGVQHPSTIAHLERALRGLGADAVDGPHERPHPDDWWFVGADVDGRRIEMYVELELDRQHDAESRVHK